VLRQARLLRSLSLSPRAVATPLPRATASTVWVPSLPTRLLAILLRGGVPSSAQSASPKLLGPAPRLIAGLINGEFSSRHGCGLTPPAAGCFASEDERYMHPCGVPVVALESSSGAARPLGGPTVGSPRSAPGASRA
jgi:hypothetical protein